MTIISKESAQINDRVRWSYKGDFGYGRIVKITKKNFFVRDEKEYSDGRIYIIQKELCFEFLRD